jgi:predicted RNA-binding Zn-ribbon protein involved in translation (DUF1610 family)
MSRAGHILKVLEDIGCEPCVDNNQGITTAATADRENVFHMDVEQGSEIPCPSCAYSIPIGQYEIAYCPRCGAKIENSSSPLAKANRLLGFVESISTTIPAGSGTTGDDVTQSTSDAVAVDQSVVVFKGDFDADNGLADTDYAKMFQISAGDVAVKSDSIAVDFAPNYVESLEKGFIGYRDKFAEAIEFDPQAIDEGENFMVVSEDKYAIVYDGILYESNDVGLFHYFFERAGTVSPIVDMAEGSAVDLIKKLGKAQYLKLMDIKNQYAGKHLKISIDNGGKVVKRKMSSDEISASKKMGKVLQKGSAKAQKMAKVGKKVMKKLLGK